MFFIIEKSEETTPNFAQNSATIIKLMETQKIVNLLNGSDNVIDSETSGAYSENEQIKFLTKSIEPGFCD